MRHGKYPLLAAFLLPPLALYGYFVLSPYAQSFLIATTNWQGLSSKYDFVGLDNFKRLFKDEYVWNALLNNLWLLVLLPLLTIVLGLFLATMLNVGGRGGRGAVTGVRGSSIYKIIYFAPQMLSVSIVGVLWMEVYNPRGGLLNGALRAVGLDGLAQVWLGDPKYAFWAVLAVMIWANVGFYVVLFGAAMQSVPRDIYEAAALDGASRTTTLVKITVPLLWDTIQVAWVYLAIIALDGFALIHVMTRGGPNFSTDVVGLRLYTEAFGDYKWGYASAIGVVMFFVTLSVTVLSLRLTRRERIEHS
ncbi:carbohydrate ABC transporter permease [Catellatospora bangladeshensis]|uniref:Sugar ABC transporter permease n=1 Tax=Catellatospora bangladeshensis TaxID=310355 RepID=A0A8J3NKN5_9ACTN|nr:sugar ABC transporter permease [Catellatospora bangladeshensis]GIF81710.1 sugar ABC transporter permease [Catellatospora bangladeshensis]